MIKSAIHLQEKNERNPDADPSNTYYVLTIGNVGHGKSTFNNALIGAHKNEVSGDTSGVTKNFQMHSSI
jgi:ribosome biogenesis GTPase A